LRILFFCQVSLGVGAEALALIQTYPRVTVAHGPGISIGLTGVPTTFYIRAKDKYGNLRTTGGDGYSLSFQGPCGINQDTGSQYASCTNSSTTHSASKGQMEPAAVGGVRTHVFDLGDGAYLASYVLTAGGKYAMSVKLQGLHIRGSPFQVTMSPDVTALSAHTGATFTGSHIRTRNAVPHFDAIGEGQYKYYLVDVADMSSDLLVQVATESGQTDVLISNTRTHPSRNSPTDVQWKSEWETGGASASGGMGGGGGGVVGVTVNTTTVHHRLHIAYTDPLFLEGPYYIAVYARQNATFQLNITVEQVARDVVLGRSYGAIVAAGRACASDTDCAARDGYACIRNLCTQRRRFRFRPTVPAHAYFFRVEAVPPTSGTVTKDACVPCPANVTDCNRDPCPCAPLRVYLSKGRPHPEGVAVSAAEAADEPTVSEAARPGEYTLCDARYTIKVLRTELSAAHYLTVEAGNSSNTTTTFTLRVAYTTNDQAPAPAIFDPAPPPRPKPTVPSDDFDHTKGQITALTLGVPVNGSVQQWQRAFYSVHVADTQSELVCRVQCEPNNGSVLLFMSASSPWPTRSRAAQVHWRSDGDSQEGKADVSLRARPDDTGFKVGTFYLSVYGYTASRYHVTCTVAALSRTSTVKIGGRYSGAVSAESGYAFFRLVTEGIPAIITVSVSLNTLGPLKKAPPLAIYIQTVDPLAAEVSLPRCSTGSQRMECLVHTSNTTCLCSGLNSLVPDENSTKILNHTCPWPCNQPFDSDQDRIGYNDYRGSSSVRAKLLPGTVYYIAVHAAQNASHYNLIAPAAFFLDISSS
jgi:hypothetical protein